MKNSIQALELDLERIKKTDNHKRIAEANNLLTIVNDCKEQLEEGVLDTEIDTILDEVTERVNGLIANPSSAGKHDLIK